MEYRIDREALDEFIGRQVELVESDPASRMAYIASIGETGVSRTFRYGSDGTRTRDLRRDSSVRCWSAQVMPRPTLANVRFVGIPRVDVGHRSSARSDSNLTPPRDQAHM
jgi:hypothetical protein